MTSVFELPRHERQWCAAREEQNRNLCEDFEAGKSVLEQGAQVGSGHQFRQLAEGR